MLSVTKYNSWEQLQYEKNERKLFQFKSDDRKIQASRNSERFWENFEKFRTVRFQYGWGLKLI